MGRQGRYMQTPAPGWAGKFKFGVNTRWGPGPISTNWDPGSVNTNLGPGPVNTNWGPGPGTKQRAGGREIQTPCLTSFINFDTFSKLQWNGSALLHYVIMFVQKLTHVLKSNTTGFLRIQRHNMKILKRILAKDCWNILG